MSIYDGLCDRGSMTNNRCPNPAEFYRNETAWCREDGQGRTPKSGREWSEIADEYKAEVMRKVHLIYLAEESRWFLYYEGELLTPKQARQLMKSGCHLSGLSLEENPLGWADSLEREAEDEMEEVKRKRREAKRIRRAFQTTYGTTEAQPWAHRR